MERTEIKEKVYEVLNNVLGIKIADIDEESSLHNDMGADSLDMVETCMDIEKVFGIVVPEDENFVNIDTPKEIIDEVEKLLNK